MQLKRKIKPLSDDERLSWNSHKIAFDQFARGSIIVILALVDCKKRELYREEYKNWEDFLFRAPWWNGPDISRQQRSQFRKAVEVVEEMESAVDKKLLERWSENSIRQLRRMVSDPVERNEVVNLMDEQKMVVNEDNIEKAFLKVRQKHEEAERAKKAECGMELRIADISGDEDEEEGDIEIPMSTTAALKEAERKVEKKSDNLGRGIDHGRLTIKNFTKAIEEIKAGEHDCDPGTLSRVDLVLHGLQVMCREARKAIQDRKQRKTASAG